MKTYNYTCTNEECDSKVRKMRTYLIGNRKISKMGSIENFPIEKPEENRDDEEPCPVCKTNMKLVGLIGGFFFQKSSLMTLEQKHAMFRERSLKHSRTNPELKDRRDWLDDLSGGKPV